MFNGKIIALIAAVGIILLVIGVVVYIVWALALRKILINVEYANPNWAWVPFLNTYAMSDAFTEDEYMAAALLPQIPFQLFKFLWLGGVIFPFIPVLGTLAGMAATFFYQFTCYRLLLAKANNRPFKEETALAVLCSFIPLVALILFFTTKKPKDYGIFYESIRNA